MHKILHELDVAGDGAFEPETIATMTDAFDAALKLLQDSDICFASDGRAEEARVIIANKIIQSVKLGGRNPLRLRDDALAHYAMAVMKHDAR